jgi:hypothetical protein
LTPAVQWLNRRDVPLLGCLGPETDDAALDALADTAIALAAERGMHLLGARAALRSARAGLRNRRRRGEQSTGTT